jgi:hypothetical protein
MLAAKIFAARGWSTEFNIAPLEIETGFWRRPPNVVTTLFKNSCFLV